MHSRGGDYGNWKFLQTRQRGALGSLAGDYRKGNLEGHKDLECVVEAEGGDTDSQL